MEGMPAISKDVYISGANGNPVVSIFRVGREEFEFVARGLGIEIDKSRRGRAISFLSRVSMYEVEEVEKEGERDG